MNGRDSLLAALVATVWGFNFVVIDWGMHDVPPLLFAAIRFTLVVAARRVLRPSPVGTVAHRRRGRRLHVPGPVRAAVRRRWPPDCHPGLAALVLQAQVIFTVAIAAAVLRERPTAPAGRGRRRSARPGWSWSPSAAVGTSPSLALTLCLLGALSWGIGNVVSRASGVSGGLSLTVWSAIVVPVPLFALSLALDGPSAVGSALAGFSWQAAVSTLYTAGLASLVGYGIFNTLLGRNPSSSVVPWVLAWLPSWRWRRPGCSSTSNPRRPS